MSTVTGQVPTDSAAWTIYITNDNCPDYTWNFTEQQTRQAFADVVKGHLDEMRRTDGERPENRDRYNMAVCQEALCFAERYPKRKEELIRRIKEGRVYVSPYLCNSLWAFQSAEGQIRTFYPARRLEREWGISFDKAHHIELPSLPWGVPTILAGCGIRALSMPYLGYDSTFSGLKCPPVFIHEGPDGSQVRVALDRWACSKSHYTQGRAILRKPESIKKEWIPHYAGLGKEYPLAALLASGTHGDISPGSGAQARGFAEGIVRYNARPGAHPTLFNATFAQFWQAVDEEQSERPFLKTIRGSFGHSWDLWPVCLARYAADMRRGERAFLAAEALLAIAGHRRPQLYDDTRTQRERAEWCWAMLSDHAWNGTSQENKRHNAELRRNWSEELNRIGRDLVDKCTSGLEPDGRGIVLFNSLSMPRRGIVEIDLPEAGASLKHDGREIACQIVKEDGHERLAFVTPEVPGFSFRQLDLATERAATTAASELKASDDGLESPYYRLVVDREHGGIARLVHKPTGRELVVGDAGRSLSQTVYFDGEEHLLDNVKSEVVALGPVLARLAIHGSTTGVEVTTLVTVYAELDQVDFDVRVTKRPSEKQERLCHVFPVLSPEATLRVAAAGAVVRPYPQPKGDLLPGADVRRFAVQELVNASSDDFCVTIVPRDAFVLRLDLDPITIEALGNDQNYREVLRNQNGETEFRFRYSLRAQTGAYRGPETIAFGQGALTPILSMLGRIRADEEALPTVTVDPQMAVATCLKPADDPASGGVILRLWEVAGESGPLPIGLKGYRKAIQTDLLERDKKELEIVDHRVSVELKAHGYAAVRLLP